MWLTFLYVYDNSFINCTERACRCQLLFIMTDLYRVKYRVGFTEATTTLNLHSPSESEAIAILQQRGTVPRGERVIILSIQRV